MKILLISTPLSIISFYDDLNNISHRVLNFDSGVFQVNYYLNAIKLAGAYTANPDSTFIKDPGGSGKMIKFHYPLDLRSVEEKMQSYPFVGAEGRFRAQQNQENSIYRNARQFRI